MKKKYKIGLMSAPLFSNNMGCNALTYGTIDILSEVADSLNIEFEYFLFYNSVTSILPGELESYNINFISRLPRFNARAFLKSIYYKDYKSRLREAHNAKNIHILMDIAWGDSFSDIYGKHRFETVYHHYLYSKKNKKPLILLPQTIGPFIDDEVKKKAKIMLEYSSSVYARDPLSAGCAKDTYKDVCIRETTDIAMFMQYIKRQSVDSDAIKIGFNPSGLLWNGGYTYKNQFNLKSDYKEIVCRVIEYLISIDDVIVELIGHDIKGPNSGDCFDDYYVCKLLQKKYPKCKVAPFFYSPVEAKSYISGLNLLIGSRMHCCIAAYSSGVPVYPLAYSRKFKGLFVDKMKYQYYSDLTIDESDKVFEDLIYFVKNYKFIKCEMFEKSSLIKNIKNELVDNLVVDFNKILKL